MSIKDFVDMNQDGEDIPDHFITPIMLADELMGKCNEALEIVADISDHHDVVGTTLGSEIEDLSTWAYLGLYFASKLRGGVALETYRQMGINSEKTKSIAHLVTALKHWEKVVEHTRDRYQPVPHVSISPESNDYTAFSWDYFTPQVKKDIEIASRETFTNK